MGRAGVGRLRRVDRTDSELSAGGNKAADAGEWSSRGGPGSEHWGDDDRNLEEGRHQRLLRWPEHWLREGGADGRVSTLSYPYPALCSSADGRQNIVLCLRTL